MGIPGRVIPALLSDRFFGPLNMIVPLAMSTRLLTYCWIAVGSLPGFYAWDVAYGFLGGGVQSLVMAASSSFTTDLKKMEAGSASYLRSQALGVSVARPLGAA